MTMKMIKERVVKRYGTIVWQPCRIGQLRLPKLGTSPEIDDQNIAKVKVRGAYKVPDTLFEERCGPISVYTEEARPSVVPLADEPT